MSGTRLLLILVWPFLMVGLVLLSCWLARHHRPEEQPNGWAIAAMGMLCFFTALFFSLPLEPRP